MPRFNTNKVAPPAPPAVTQSVEDIVYDKLAEGSNITPDKKLTEQQANANLSELVAEVYAKIAEAQKLADEYELNFSLDVEYGMGGSYEDGQWHPSSQSC